MPVITKREGTSPHTVSVTFEIPSSIWAESVHLVGDFNNWDMYSLPLARANAHSNWRITLELERGRSYQFRYLLDRKKWSNDYDADHYASNPFGGENSVVET